jgi:hypothetical protein
LGGAEAIKAAEFRFTAQPTGLSLHKLRTENRELETGTDLDSACAKATNFSLSLSPNCRYSEKAQRFLTTTLI